MKIKEEDYTAMNDDNIETALKNILIKYKNIN
jgi:hypothetical protein